MGRNVGIYTRISLDREGKSESPDRQEQVCRARVEERNWNLVGVYSDPDVSAFKRGAKRPQYERLLKDIKDGVVDCVVVSNLDRLTRGGLSAIGRVLDVLEMRGGQIVAVDDHLDSSEGAGELIMGVLASIAKKESQNTSARVKAAHRSAASKGRVHSGGSRQFGYERSGVVIPEEAAIVRELADRIWAGESLRQLAFDLNRRGIKTTQGNQWYSVTVGHMIRSPRLAGLRVYSDGPDRKIRDVFPGDWEPILSQEEHVSLLATMARPLATRRSVVRHLLTGLVVCGKCGGALKTMGFVMKNGQPFPRYQCLKQPGHMNCGNVAITKNSLDAYVTDLALGFLSRAKLRPLEDDEGTEQALKELIDEDAQALRELTHERFVSRTVAPDAYEPARRALQDRLDQNEQALDSLRRRIDDTKRSLRLGNRADLDAWWKTATIEEQRATLARVFSKLEIMPAKHRGGNKFDTGRVRQSYRWDLYMRAGQRFEETATPEELDQAEREYLVSAAEELWGEVALAQRSSDVPASSSTARKRPGQDVRR